MKVLRRTLKRVVDKKEYFDSPEELERKAAELAELIQQSKHFIAFTGAGVSTSSGIPDFRSAHDTVNETGPGMWERDKNYDASHLKRVDSLKAIPSIVHMSLSHLLDLGFLKHIITQNVDSIHRRSGVTRECISELHGSNTTEACLACGVEYLREYKIRRTDGLYTGRRCDICSGPLVDTLVHFGESLNKDTLQNALRHTHRADFCLVIGSSLTVAPAALFPKTIAENPQGKLAIVNLQRSPLDQAADVRIFSQADSAMQVVMRHLGLEIPEYRVKRYVRVKREGEKIAVEGTDCAGRPYTFLKTVQIGAHTSQEEPHEFDADGLQTIKLDFYSHLDEPQLSFDVQLASLKKPMHFLLTFNPYTAEWEPVHEQL